MKREAEGEMGSPQKRSRRGDEELHLLIPSKVAGSIIGKGGKKITNLRSQYKASITVPDCPGPERILTLSSDLDTVCNIVKDIVPHLKENGLKSQNEVELRMLIHQSQAGCVIGKGGAKVKEIREKTGAHVKIFSKCAPQSTDRIIQIIGESSKCIDTIREIITLIKGSPVKGFVNPYNPHNYDEFYANEYGGYGGMQEGGGGGGGNRRMGGGGGGSGSGGPGGPANRGGGGGDRFNNRPPPFGGPRGGPMGGGGPFNDRGLGGGPPPPPRGGNSFSGPPPQLNGGGFERDNNWGGPMNGGSSGGPMGRPLGGGGGMSSGANNGTGGRSQTTQVTIPKDLAGAIIGKGGSRIRQIRIDSGAGITIDEPLPGSNDRIITITGNPNQIQMAQYLLQQSVHNNAERNNY